MPLFHSRLAQRVIIDGSGKAENEEMEFAFDWRLNCIMVRGSQQLTHKKSRYIPTS